MYLTPWICGYTDHRQNIWIWCNFFFVSEYIHPNFPINIAPAPVSFILDSIRFTPVSDNSNLWIWKVDAGKKTKNSSMDENIVAEEQVQQVALQSEPPTDEVVSQEVVASAVTVDVDKTLYVSFFFQSSLEIQQVNFFWFWYFICSFICFYLPGLPNSICVQSFGCNPLCLRSLHKNRIKAPSTFDFRIF